LERCLNDKKSPIDNDTANNLRFLIGLRHEIEHQMTSRIDDILSARFQACGLNYNECVMKLFGADNGIEKHLSFSLQFSTISTEQKELLEQYPSLPANIQGYINGFDANLSDEEFSNPHYAYRILFIPKTANRKGQADRVIEQGICGHQGDRKKEIFTKASCGLDQRGGISIFLGASPHTALEGIGCAEYIERLWGNGGGKNVALV
jgi:hypothetical protein